MKDCPGRVGSRERDRMPDNGEQALEWLLAGGFVLYGVDPVSSQ